MYHCLHKCDLLEGDYLIDSHCHFDFEVFDQERENCWHHCLAAGVRRLLIPGVEPAQWSKAYDIVTEYTGIVMSAGLHPWWIHQASLPDLSYWHDTLNQEYCVAVGECGLDAMIGISLDQQQYIFTQHLLMALEHDLPIIIHVRRAHNALLQLLKRYPLPRGGVIHGFTGSYELAMRYWNMGFYIGVGGSITYDRAAKTRAAIRAMPLEALVLETDAPDMPLKGYQGQANSPLHLVGIAKALAALRHQNLSHIVQQTTKNTEQLFSLC